jgi:hypothetical protein
MNIFKVLSSGDSSIHEPHITAFLAYLLDPKNEHGLGSSFLEQFLHPLVMENKQYFKNIIFKDVKITDLSTKSRFEISVETEKRVSPTKNKSRDIDILIEIFETVNQKKQLIHSICVENKIKDGALQPDQLKEEMQGLKKENDEKMVLLKGKSKTISLIFLTNNYSNNCNEIFKNWRGDKEDFKDIPACHLTWKASECEENNKKSIFNQFSNLLKKESLGLIEPIHEHTKYTIKSLLNFIKSDFKSYKKEKQEQKESIGEIDWDNLKVEENQRYSSYIINAVNFCKCNYLQQFQNLAKDSKCDLSGFFPTGGYFYLKKDKKNILQIFLTQKYLHLHIRMELSNNNEIFPGFNAPREQYLAWQDYTKTFPINSNTEKSFPPEDLNNITNAVKVAINNI